VEQELSILPEHLRASPVFSGVLVARFLVFWVMFCRSLFFLLSFFLWPLCCLSFFAYEVSSDVSYCIQTTIHMPLDTVRINVIHLSLVYCLVAMLVISGSNINALLPIIIYLFRKETM
jgi:hypothetical protein